VGAGRRGGGGGFQEMEGGTQSERDNKKCNMISPLVEKTSQMAYK
jgi:hypothetical protein